MLKRILLTLLFIWAHSGAFAANIKLLNVSYDPTRELYQELNAVFAREWKAKTGMAVTFHQSHGGSGSQARAVIDGLGADVVTLALGYDIDVIAERGLLAKNWQDRLPYRSSPYTSTIVFLVRKGNPKNIQDWSDLIKPGISVLTPNPKTSGGARWNVMAAYGYALRKSGSDEEAKNFLAHLFQNVVVLDAGARASMTSFVERGIGDVLIGWENEAMLAQAELASEQFEVITPSISILAEPPVAWVDKNVKKRGTAELAKAYLKFLYSREGQEIVARYYYRPRSQEVLEEYAQKFPKLQFFTIDSLGGWMAVQKKFFAENGIFDQIFAK